MASLPYPLNRLYTHIVSVIATTQSACILMSVWVWQGCHTLLQIPILLFLNNMFSCPLVFPQQHVLLFFCLFKNNMFSCSLVFLQQHVLMFLLSFQTTTCSHVLLSFQTTTCSHVLMSSKQKPVLMFSCLSPTTCSSVFPPKEPYPPSNPVFMSPKKRLRATLPAVKP